MGLIQIKGLSKFFGIRRVFEGVSAEIRPGDRIGLIGANGTGKTTLLRCLLGLEEYDGGEVALSPGETLAYVEQQSDFGTGTLQEELLGAFSELLILQNKLHELEALIASASGAELDKLMQSYGTLSQAFDSGGGYEYEQRLAKIITGLGFTEAELARPVTSFSGGQQTRIALAKALVRDPDYLFLDEPTNHLDLVMVEWLENYLAAFRGGLLIISHDRYFLDQVTTKTWELEAGSLREYQGNYSTYLDKKVALTLAAERAYAKQQDQIAKTEEYIRRYGAGIKSKQARGRAKQLSRLERLEAVGGQAQFDFFEFNALGDSAQRVLDIQDAAAGYGETMIFQDLALAIRRGEGVALIGPNGAGKTTLLKAITGELELRKGSLKLGSRVQVGYFAQQHENLHPDWQVLDEIVRDFGMSEERARHYLGAFLFRGDDVFKEVGSLSGGEEARLALLKLMLTGANFLILDEPTNHLDIPAKEAVEEALAVFPGTFLTVSHDRYFLDKVAERVIELKDGAISDYPGNYSDYKHFCEKRAKEAALAAEAAPKTGQGKASSGLAKAMASSQVSPNKVSSENVAESTSSATKSTASRSVRRDAAAMEKLELRIRELEVMLKFKEKEINLPENQADLAVSQALYEEYEAMKAELDEVYETWLMTQEE
ncbi:MAG: ABC-F family ATP-binding cassette domain-containing protein [Sporomusaceae bacterium]|nr:ABC-F family ATP-binding cassette domain-containing protein [Sporomusaceae bacterium]